MQTDAALKRMAALKAEAERDDDAMMFCYFSRREDKFQGFATGMDFADALIIINALIEKFRLSREALGLATARELSAMRRPAIQKALKKLEVLR